MLPRLGDAGMGDHVVSFSGFCSIYLFLMNIYRLVQVRNIICANMSWEMLVHTTTFVILHRYTAVTEVVARSTGKSFMCRNISVSTYPMLVLNAVCSNPSKL